MGWVCQQRTIKSQRTAPSHSPVKYDKSRSHSKAPVVPLQCDASHPAPEPAEKMTSTFRNERFFLQRVSIKSFRCSLYLLSPPALPSPILPPPYLRPSLITISPSPCPPTCLTPTCRRTAKHETGRRTGLSRLALLLSRLTEPLTRMNTKSTRPTRPTRGGVRPPPIWRAMRC